MHLLRNVCSIISRRIKDMSELLVPENSLRDAIIRIPTQFGRQPGMFPLIKLHHASESTAYSHARGDFARDEEHPKDYQRKTRWRTTWRRRKRSVSSGKYGTHTSRIRSPLRTPAFSAAPRGSTALTCCRGAYSSPLMLRSCPPSLTWPRTLNPKPVSVL